MATHSSIPTWGCKESDMTECARARAHTHTHTHTHVNFFHLAAPDLSCSLQDLGSLLWLAGSLAAACRI